jgi:cysteine-rich repeat protein
MIHPVTAQRLLFRLAVGLGMLLMIAVGFLLMSGSPLPSGKNSIPLPFGTINSLSFKGVLTDLGTTSDNRRIVDMTFDNGEISEPLGINALTFILTPSAAESFSAGAPFSVALTSDSKLYGYKYTTRDAAIETAVNDEMKASQGTPKIFYYADRFPGTFFAPAEQLADPTSVIAKFIAEKSEIGHSLHVASTDVLTLETDARYLIVAEEEGILITARGLAWCGDRKIRASEICDDGNRKNDDGCSDRCAVETGYSCASEPSVCIPGSTVSFVQRKGQIAGR